MKKLILFSLFLFAIENFAQTPFNICSGLTEEDVPVNAYFKDINHTFDKFIDVWQWTNGNEILTFKLSKITHKFRPDVKVFRDFMVGNYSYSDDGGNTFIVNTITLSINDNPDANPMYASCVEDSNSKIIFGFEDVIIDKGNSYCTATFKFLPGSLTQIQVTIENSKGGRGRMEGQPPFNPNFTIPTSIIITKQ